MKSQRIYAIIFFSTLLLLVQSCTEEHGNVITSSQSIDLQSVERIAFQDQYVSNDLVSLANDEAYPVEIKKQPKDSRDTTQWIRLVRKTRVVEKSSVVEQLNDSMMVILLHKRSSGEAIIFNPHIMDSLRGNNKIKKSISESFMRRVLFWKTSEVHHDDEELRGYVSGLVVNLETGTGSFMLTMESSLVDILFTTATSFDDVTPATLRNGDFVEVETRDHLVSGTDQLLASSIEREGDHHEGSREHWKKAALSLLEGGTSEKSAKIRELRIAFSDTNVITVQSPLDFLLYYRNLPPLLPFLKNEIPIRISVNVESVKPDPDIVILRRGNVEHGNVSLKHQLMMTSDLEMGGVHQRTYEGTIHPHHRGGHFNVLLEVWTYESLFDTTAQISTHVWGMPYAVH